PMSAGALGADAGRSGRVASLTLGRGDEGPRAATEGTASGRGTGTGAGSAGAGSVVAGTAAAASAAGMLLEAGAATSAAGRSDREVGSAFLGTSSENSPGAKSAGTQASAAGKSVPAAAKAVEPIPAPSSGAKQRSRSRFLRLSLWSC